MRRLMILSACAAAWLVSTLPSFGQGVPPMSVGTNNERLMQPVVPKPPADAAKQPPDATATTKPKGEADKDCDPFLFNDPYGNWIADSTRIKTLTECITVSAAAAEQAAAKEIVSTLDLIRAHVNYKQFKHWAARAEKDRRAKPKNEKGELWNAPNPDLYDLKRAITNLKQQIHDALAKHHLNDPLTAMLFTGASFGDAAATTGKAANGTETTTTKKQEGTPVGPSAFLLFESPHFRDDESDWLHFAFGGRVGFQQIMSMVKPTAEAGTTPTDTTPVAAYKDGLGFSAGATAYTLSKHQSEAYVRVSIGGTRLGDARTVLTGDNEQQAFLGVPADADTTTAMRYDIGIGWNYHGKPMEVAHLEKGLLNPAFSAFLMRRKDDRYKKTGDLKDFTDPDKRWVAGFSVNLRNLVRNDGADFAPTKANTFDFGFSFEREFAGGSSGLRIPQSSRYIVRGEINILRALAGTPKEQKAGTSGAGAGGATEGSKPGAGSAKPPGND